MVIDFHTHPTQVGVLGFTGRLAKYMGGIQCDASLETLLKQMDQGGINKSVVLPWGPFLLECNPREVPNDFVADVVRKYPDRFIGFAGVDVHAEDAAKRLERDVKKHNLKGLKIHPAGHEIAINDPKLYPVYEKCLELNIPVILHCGECFERLGRFKYSDPLLLDEVAVSFPDLTIIMAHGGSFTDQSSMHDKAIMVCAKNKNVYLETSWTFETFFREALIRLGPERLLFGSDFPFQNPSFAVGKVQLILTHFLFDMPGIIRDPKEIEMIMGGNAARILGIKE